MNIDLIWQNFLERIKETISPMLYETWFSETKLVDLNNTTATVIVPMHIHKKHLSENYNDLVEEIFTDITGTNFKIVRS